MSVAKRLAICESESQVNFLKEKRSCFQSITNFFAAEAEAAWAFEKNRIDFFPLENFQTTKDSEFVEGLLKKKILWAQKTDRILQDNIPHFQQCNFHPARYYLYYLQLTWDTLLHRANLLEKLSANYPIDELIYFSNNRQSAFNDNLLSQESVLTSCIPIWADYHGISTTGIPYEQWYQNRKYQKRDCPGITQIKDSLLIPKKKVFRFLRNLKEIPFLLNKPKQTIQKIVINPHYDITSELCDYLKTYSFSFAYLDDFTIGFSDKYPKDHNLDSMLKNTWEQINSERWFWDCDGTQPWALKTVIEPQFRHFWFEIIPKLWHFTHLSQREIERQKVNAVLLSNISGIKDLGLIIAAKMKKIPVFFYMHGANMGDVENTVWDVTDRYFSDYMLVYGTGESEYINNHRPKYSDINVQTIPVGSARMDLIRRQNTNAKTEKIRHQILGSRNIPIVLYVPGGLPANIFRYSYHDFRNIKTFEIRKQVAEIFKNENRVQFVYKPFSATASVDPTRDMLQHICPSCKIVNNISLPELQLGANLIIHEMPSTGFHEGLLTDNPIITFVDKDVFHMPDNVKKMLKKRITLSETGVDFINDIRSAMASGSFTGSFNPIQNANNEFLKQYLTYHDDGKSAVRAANTIQNIIKTKRRE